MLFSGDPVWKTLHPDRKRIIGIGMPEAVRAVEVPHVPKLRAQFLGHANAVARVTAACCVYHGRHLPILPLHFLARLEPPTGENDALAGLDPPLAIFAINQHADYLAIHIAD